MRKFILFLLFALPFFMSNYLFAQDDTSKHQIDVMISDVIPVTIIHSFSNLFSQLDTSEYKKVGDRKDSGFGVFGLRYQYKMNNTIALGAEVDFMRITNKQKVENINTNEISRLSRKTDVLNLLAVLGVNYYTNKSQTFTLYGNIAGGIMTFSSEKYAGLDSYSESFLGFQINPIGFRYGKDFGVFLEFGMGTRGIFSIGGSYKL